MRGLAGFATAGVAVVSLMSLALALVSCTRSAPDATPDGAVRLFVEKMESGGEDPRAMHEAYGLLGAHARANLKERAERASRGQGKRYEPWEMLAEGRFGLKFRPKGMTSHIDGDDATVDVRGDGDEHASVHCAREGGAWRVEPELPDLAQPAKRSGP